MHQPTPYELALHAARQMLDKGAEDLVVLHLPPSTGAPFDYVVIANGRSERQAATLVAEVYHFCKRHDIKHLPVEGDAGWRVIDCMDVVAHAFVPETRAYYALEDLWPEAEPVDYAAALADLPDPDRS
ncbi:MAG: ribosome silencing factor [Planctomycetota bacterium]